MKLKKFVQGIVLSSSMMENYPTSTKSIIQFFTPADKYISISGLHHQYMWITTNTKYSASISFQKQLKSIRNTSFMMSLDSLDLLVGPLDCSSDSPSVMFWKQFWTFCKALHQDKDGFRFSLFTLYDENWTFNKDSKI